MPHFGQESGLSLMTSGCIGQVYLVPAGIGSGAGTPSRYLCGSASNLSWQRAEQNQNFRPSWRAKCGAFARVTLMPQTGSTAVR